MLTEGRNPLSQRVSECRRARGRGGVQSGLRSSSLPSWCLSCCGNVYVGAGDKGPLSPYFSFIHRSAWKENSAKFAWPQQNTCERGNRGAPGRTKKWPELCIAHDSFRETMWREKPELPCEEPRFGWCATRRNLGGGRRVVYFVLTRPRATKTGFGLLHCWDILGPTSDLLCGKITHLRYALWPAGAL